MNNNPIYTIVVKDKEGTTIGEFNDWLNLRFSDRANNYGICSFDIPVTSQELITLTSLRRYDIFIQKNGTTVWSGEQANRSVKLEANSPQLLTLTCFTFFEMLNARFSPPYVRYDETDQSEILWTEVDESQGQTDGDLGFTLAELEETVDRDREYFNQNLMEAFINMSNNINGPDFWVDHDKGIHFKETRGVDKSTQIVFEYNVNIFEANVDENFATPGNQAIVLGAGFGSEQLVIVVTDTQARETYKLRQQLISEIDVSEATTLGNKGSAIVTKYRSPILTVNFSQVPNSLPLFGTIQIGDTVRLKINQGIYNINDKYRIYGYEVTIGSEGEEYVSYLVAQI